MNNPIGTAADKKAHVDISAVHGGYFSNEINLKDFIDIGIKPIESKLPKSLLYGDFGGGQGHLTSFLRDYLVKNGFQVQAVVIDANDEYLKEASKKGLETKLCNLENVIVEGMDLISMRAVLHYNIPENQIRILQNIYTSLKTGGYLVHQNSSGSKENCELRSALVNIPELGRAGEGEYHWVSEDEHDSLLRKVGFMENVHAGYALENAWGPEEQWERFHGYEIQKRREEGDGSYLAQLEIKKETYLKKAYELIEKYSKKYGDEHLGIKRENVGKVMIQYKYPIVISKK